MTYQEQSKEIEKLAKSIIKKSKGFAKNNVNPYYDDLSHVLSELREIDEFIK